MKDGKRCSGSIPYGYNRLPSDKQTLVVDPVASEVVKRIFTLANDGKSTRAIAEILTEEKVLTPAAYAKEYHPEQYNGNKFTNPYLWAMSTIRNILGRQEYLGHTVLRKSVSTNFKLHKRKSTDEEEQYVFPNTHEPIISQELWDSVQKRRSRVNRASAWGTHSNRLSGYLYCADCGRRMTLQTHYSKKDGSVQYSYRCGGYASRVNSCTSHSISTDNVEALILSSVKRFSRFVLNDEQAFALELQSLWNEKQEEKPKHNQSELQRCQKRYDELSTLVRGLYENLMSGLLPERQYKQLMKQYDDEQAELETKMETMKTELAEEKVSSVDIKHFISLIRKCKNPTEISDTMFNELVDKIVVYEVKRGKYTSVKGARQKRFIRFRTLGAGYSEEELKAVISGEAEHHPRQKQKRIVPEQKFQMLVDIQAKLAEGKSMGYARWAKRYNLKEMSKTLIFLQEHKIGSIKEMQERVDAATARYHELGDSIKAAEARMTEIAVLRTHIVNYARTRPVYDAYRKAGYSKRFLEAHREEITLHKAAKAAFDEAGLKKLPKTKDLSIEYAELLKKKKEAYPDYRKAQDEMQELMKAQKNVEMFFAEEKDTAEKEPTR